MNWHLELIRIARGLLACDEDETEWKERYLCIAIRKAKAEVLYDGASWYDPLRDFPGVDAACEDLVNEVSRRIGWWATLAIYLRRSGKPVPDDLQPMRHEMLDDLEAHFGGRP